MGVETTCLKEAAHLAKRDMKYWIVVGHLYLSGLFKPKQAKTVRSAYFFCRHIDDVLDGDRTISEDPEDYAYAILDSIERGGNKPKIMELYNYAIKNIEPRNGDKPKEDFKEVINVMIFDYCRSKFGAVFSSEELDDYFNKTFEHVLNLSFMISGSNLRGKDIPEIVSSMGHIYSIRDMETDISRKIINIPSEELQMAGINGDISYEKIRNNRYLLDWIDNEILLGLDSLDVCRQKLDNADKASRKVCLPLVGAMERYCKKYLN